jgi:hypothetical protein
VQVLQSAITGGRIKVPPVSFNPLNAELNPIRHLLALAGAHHFVHVSKIRVNERTYGCAAGGVNEWTCRGAAVGFNEWRYAGAVVSVNEWTCAGATVSINERMCSGATVDVKD